MSLNLRSREITRLNSSLVYSSTPVREPQLNKSRSTGNLNLSVRENLQTTMTGSSDCFQSTETVRSFDVSPEKVDCRPTWVGKGISQTSAFMSQLSVETLEKENQQLIEQVRKLGMKVEEQTEELESLRLSVVRLTDELSQSESTVHRLQDDLSASTRNVKTSTSASSLDDMSAKLDTLCHVVHMLCEERGVCPTPVLKEAAFQTVTSRRKVARRSSLPTKIDNQIVITNSFQALESESAAPPPQPQSVQQQKQKKNQRRKKRAKKMARKKIILVLEDSQS